MIGRQIAHYTILGDLGEGGMGVVYLAEDTRLHRKVALKLLPRKIAVSADDRNRLMTEARAAASLNHRNIATIHAIEETDDEIFIVMEFVKGEELKAAIDRHPFGVVEATEIALQVAKGLEAAHRGGVVHRDIKSSNIMITEDRQVRIMDFGLARIGQSSGVTQPGTTIGTIAYMSPEQARGDEVDHRTDVWSFGVLLYELLTGELPFKGEYDQVLIYSILNQDPSLDREELGGLREVIRKALTKERGDRYQSMEQVIRDLSAQETDHSTVIRPHGPAVKRVAILPFSNLIDDPATNYLGFALADQVIGSLVYSRGILVRPSGTIRKYQNVVIDIGKAAAELQVGYVMTGNYLKEGDAIRLNVELVEVPTETIVWHESIQVRYSNVFELQDIVAGKVIEGLNLRFPEGKTGQGKPDIPRNPAAYEFYLKAIAYPHTMEGGNLAIRMLEQAIGLDPDYAPAYLELGVRYNQLSQVGEGTAEASRKAEEALLKAISLKSNLLPALAYLALIYTDVGRHEEADEKLMKAVEVNPEDPWIRFSLSYHYRYIGFLQEAAAEFRRAVSIDPGNRRFRSGIVVLMYLGEYDEAERLALDRESPFTLNYLGEIAYRRGDLDRSRRYFEQVVAMKDEVGEFYFASSILSLMDGDPEAAADFTLKRELENPADGEIMYEIARVYGLLGRGMDCRRALKKSLALGYISYPAMAWDSFLDRVRADDGIASLLSEAERRYEELREALSRKRGTVTLQPTSHS